MIKLLLAVLACLGMTACSDHTESGHDDHHDEAAHEEVIRGPHGGRLLQHEEFAVELAIFESGVPPEYRVWLYRRQQALPPTAATVVVAIVRLDGERSQFAFRPERDFLRGVGTVDEPHSFDVAVTANESGGKPMEWKFSSYEGRTQIADATATQMGVTTSIAGPAILKNQVTLSGTVRADPTRISRVRARYPGVVREVAVQPAAVVARGALLAQIQSNESLQNYPLSAPIGGTVVEHRAQIGEATGDEPLFTIIDVSKVWVDLDVFQSELSRIEENQVVELFDLDGRELATGRISRIAPLAVHGSQSVRALVVIDNVSGSLRPGQFVTGRVTVAEINAALAIEKTALQRFRDADAIFVRIGDTYEVRMPELGRSDATHVEVLDGLKPQSVYVTGNSYLIKADIEKSGASHDH